MFGIKLNPMAIVKRNLMICSMTTNSSTPGGPGEAETARLIRAFSERFSQRRKELKITQQQMAEKLGVSTQAISAWENQKTLPEYFRLVAISGVLDVGLGWLLGDTGSLINAQSEDAQARDPIPLISLKTSYDWFENAAVAAKPVIEGFLVSEYRGKGLLIAITMPDNSMEPQISKGDHLVVDTRQAEVPGDIVVCGITESRSILVRRVRIRSSADDRALMQEFLPINADYPSNFIRDQADGFVFGVVIEIRRYRKLT